MKLNYGIKADQVLKMLGYDGTAGEEFINGFERENNVKLPSCLRSFYKAAFNCPLLETADIWTDGMCFLYEQIEERIEEFAEDYGDNPEEGADDGYYRFALSLSKIPKEQWHEHVTDYLEIGSDYGAGVVNYGICVKDLDKEDPPVYYLNEDDEMTDWKPLCSTLSEYFMLAICDSLLCYDYDTAEYVINEAGLGFSLDEYDEAEKTAEKMGIDLSTLRKQVLSWGEVTWGYDEEKKVLVVAGINDNYKNIFRVCTIDINSL